MVEFESSSVRAETMPIAEKNPEMIISNKFEDWVINIARHVLICARCTPFITCFTFFPLITCTVSAHTTTSQAGGVEVCRGYLLARNGGM